MVWSQYVYEATTGLDTYVSDDDEYQDIPPDIEDWEVKYSEQLWMMWGTFETLMYDAMMDSKCTFTDFVAFCYDEHDEMNVPEGIDANDQMYHIWKNIRRIINANGLHEEMMRGATFYHFCGLVQDKYISVY
jgi:hypothetical protein